MMPTLDHDEARRRLPEIRDIRDEDLRDEVTRVVVEGFPDYFWTAAAASSYHPPEHQQRHGLWLHVKRVCTCFERMSTSMVKQDHLDWDEIDRGRAACILHEMFKYGRPPTTVQETVDNHAVLAAQWLSINSDAHDDVRGAVEAVNGPWYAGSAPSSHLEQIVHIADMQASDEDVRIAVKKPHDVLQEAFPRVAER